MNRGLLLLVYPIFLASCASNDELFAEYDELNICGKCNNKIEMSMVNATAMPETFIWEPAVYFGFDLDYLEPVEIARLDRDLEVLNANESLRVVLRGFTDAWASVDYNRDLSQRRVQTVRLYLKEQGLDPQRIREVPLDERNPLVNNQKSLERAINRHVELMLVDENWQPVRLEVMGTERVPDGPKIDNEPDNPPPEQ